MAAFVASGVSTACGASAPGVAAVDDGDDDSADDGGAANADAATGPAIDAGGLDATTGAGGAGDAASGEAGTMAPDGSTVGDASSGQMDSGTSGDDGGPPPPVALPFAIDGVANAVAHDGNSWYVGGSFGRVSNRLASDAYAVDFTGAPAPACASALATGFDGEVHAFAQAGASIYAGGDFAHYQGVSVVGVAKIDATTCALDAAFNGSASGGVTGVKTLAAVNGSLYIGGSFTKYEGGTYANLVKVDASTGAVDTTFSPAGANGFDGQVDALLVSGTTIYAGGSFTAYRGVANSTSNIAALALDTGAVVPGFQPAGSAATSGFNGPVLALATDGTHLYVGGGFSAYRGVAGSASSVAKIGLTDGALDATFDPPGANGVNGTVQALAVGGTSLYIGGHFSAYRGGATPVNALVKVALADGTLDTAFLPVAENGFQNKASVLSLVVSGTSLYAGGVLTTYGAAAEPIGAMAKLDLATGALDDTFRPSDSTIGGVAGRGAEVAALLATGSTLWVGGTFQMYGGNQANNLAKIDDTTFAPDTTFDPPGAASGIDGAVYALYAMNGNLYIGGNFQSYRGTTGLSELAKVDDTTGVLDTTFSAANATNGPVYAFTSIGSSLYVGGLFTTYRGVAANHLAKVDATSGVLDTTFDGAGSVGFDDAVFALGNLATSVYVGGAFTAYRGVAGSASRLAKLDATDGTLDTTFGPAGAGNNGFDQTVAALAVYGGTVYAGGSFGAYRGVAGSATRLAKLDATTGHLDTAFSPPGAAFNGFDGDVLALVVANGSLYAGGSFAHYNGTQAGPAASLAKLDIVSGALDTTFDPGSSSGFAGTVNAIAAAGRTVFCGGAMTRYRGTTLTPGVAAIDSQTGAVASGN